MISNKKGSGITVASRNTPPSIFFSIFGILNIKRNRNGKKLLSRKNGDSGDSEDLSILGMDGELDLPDDLVNSEDLMDIGGALGDGILEMGNSLSSASSDIEANVTDLKNQVDKLEIGNSSVQNEISTIREDINQINDSIRSLLCIYEAVSKEYNPFVDSSNEDKKNTISIVEEEERLSNLIHSSKEPSDTIGEDELGGGPEFEDGDSCLGTSEPMLEFDSLNLDSNVEEKIMISVDSAFEPFDPSEPTDRILKADEEEDENSNDDIEDSVESLLVGMPVLPDPMPVKESKVTQVKRNVDLGETGSGGSSESKVDSYCLNQIVKIVEYKIEKIHTSRLRGKEIGVDEIQSLERWISELLN